MYCEKCGEKLPENAVFCSSCGFNFGEYENIISQRDNNQANSTTDSVQQDNINLEEEIAQLPEKFKPLNAWAYFGYSILYGIPIIGIISLIWCAFCTRKNINLRNFARSYFCIYVIFIVVFIIIRLIAHSYNNSYW